MAVYKRGSTWWIDIWVADEKHPKGGYRVRESAGTTDRFDALEYELKRKKQLMNGHIPAPEKPVADLTLKQAFDKMLEDHYHGKASEDSVVSHIKTICDVVSCDTPLRLIDSRFVEDLKKQLKATGNSEPSVNRKLSTLKKTLETACYKWKAMPEVPYIEHYSENKGRIIVIPTDMEREILRVTGSLDKDCATVLLILFETGMRLSEALNLEWEQIKLDDKKIELWRTKNGEARCIPMTAKLHAVLAGAREMFVAMGFPVEGRLFHCSANRLQYVWATMKKLLKVSDPDFTIHAIRHTVASRLVKSGVDLYKVAKLLGHKTIKTTERYAHLDIEDLRGAAEILDAYSLTSEQSKENAKMEKTM